MDAIEAQALGMIAENDCRSIDELAQRQGRTVTEVWRELCVNAGKAECPLPADVPRSLKSRN